MLATTYEMSTMAKVTRMELSAGGTVGARSSVADSAWFGRRTAELLSIMKKNNKAKRKSAPAGLSRPFSKEQTIFHRMHTRTAGCGPLIFSYVGICKSERVRVTGFSRRFFAYFGCGWSYLARHLFIYLVFQFASFRSKGLM